MVQLFSLGIMEHQTKKVPTPWWLGLMYATGALLIPIGAVPPTVIFAFLLARVDSSIALTFAVRLIPAEIFISVALFFIAKWIDKRRQMIEK